MTAIGPATAADLVASAAKQGVHVTARLITDWVERGLLDAPERRSAGRGKGSHPAVFSRNQHNLFLTLIDKRKTVRSISDLAKIPLWLWLYFGETYVPTRQAHRALRTWATSVQSVNLKNARASASTLIEQVAAPNAPTHEMRQLRDLVTGINHQGRVSTQDAARLEELLDIVVDPRGTNARIGPPGLQIDAATFVRSTLHESAGLHAVLADEIDDDLLDAAARQLRLDLAEYLALQPHLLRQLPPDADARIGLETTVEQDVQQVGHRLLKAIGVQLALRDDQDTQ